MIILIKTCVVIAALVGLGLYLRWAHKKGLIQGPGRTPGHTHGENPDYIGDSGQTDIT